MVVGVRQAAGLQAADLLGLSHWHKHLQGLQRMVPKREKISSESAAAVLGGKGLGSVRSQSGQTGGRLQKGNRN